jgi:hypothetical protein
MVADQSDAALAVEVLAVEAHDACGFLAAMLERMQAERSQRRGVRVVENTEYAALFVQPVFLKPAQDGIFNLSLFGHGHGPPPHK